MIVSDSRRRKVAAGTGQTGAPRLEQDGFRDRNQRYVTWWRERTPTVCWDPTVLALGGRHLERFSRDDPHRRDGYRLWEVLLREPVSVVAARLTERSAAGDYRRETAPSFGGLANGVRVRLLREALVPLLDAAEQNPVPY